MKVKIEEHKLNIQEKPIDLRPPEVAKSPKP